jgi:NADH dehydrogenase
MILITGATGFIGRHLVEALRPRDREIRCLVRSRTRGYMLEERGCALAEGDMTDPESLRAACSRVDVIVHLVALIRGRVADFDQIMVGGTRDLIEAAVQAGSRRLVLVSALGLSEQTRALTPYYRAKWLEEQALKESSLEHVIFRPSFVSGRDGGAFPTFVRLVRYSPVTPVLGPGTQLVQPIAVEDVAAHLASAVDLDGAANRSFDLAGPDRVSWNELYALIARVLGKRRGLVHIPFGLAGLQAALLDRLPGFPYTRDQVKMIAAGDNVGEIGSTSEVFGLPLTPLEEQIRRAAARRGG